MRLAIWNSVTSVWDRLTKGAAAKADAIAVTMATDQPAIAGDITKVGGTAIAIGPAAKAAAIPVTMATDQPAQDANITKIGGTALAIGPAAKAAAIPVTMATDQPEQKSDLTKVGGAALALGAAAKAAAIPVTMATDQPAQKVRGEGNYQAVAAAQADAVLGAAGAVGDYLERVILVPANLNPGACAIKDGAGAALTILAGGAASLTEVKPIVIEVHAQSAAGAWKLTTGADVTAIAIGKFTAA